jgi:hypothetical protein
MFDLVVWMVMDHHDGGGNGWQLRTMMGNGMTIMDDHDG